MKLILDEWVVREVIDTLYMARTTLLGITGLDSPQDVEKKSANETAITRRISKAISIIQQSEQPHISESLDEVAEEYRRESYRKSVMPNIDGPMPEYGGSIKDAFIAGAEWQAEQFEKNRLAACDAQTKEEYDREVDFATRIIEQEHRQPTLNDAINYGMKLQKKQMLKEAVEGTVHPDDCEIWVNLVGYGYKFNDGDKVRIIIVKEDEK